MTATMPVPGPRPGDTDARAPSAPSGTALTSASLAGALATGGLAVHYQPIVSLPTGAVSGFESLARLTMPDGRSLPPAAFIPLAEADGQIGFLGTQVLDRALERAGRWRRTSAALSTASVSVNVSPRQLVEGRLPDVVLGLARRHDVPPTAVLLEITEGAAVDAAARPVLHELSSLGFRIALDDFGTGFANLDHLRRLPLHVLKLDRTFVAGVTSSGPDRAVVRSAIQLADALGLTLIAEGIETAEQADILRVLGCAHGQGFLFGGPGPDPVELALAVPAVLPVRRAAAATPGLPWDPETEAVALSAARLLARPGDRARGAASHLAGRLAGMTRAGDVVAYLAPRLALLHDIARLGGAGVLPPLLTSAPGVRVLLGGLPRDPAERAAVALARRAATVAAAATAADPQCSAESVSRACRDAALAGGPDAAALRVLAGEPLVVPTAHQVLDELHDRRLRRLVVEDRLRAVAGLSHALTSTSDTSRMLRMAVEEARRIVGAASASLGRWERDTDTVRTLVNVGDLAEGEVTFPVDEVYRLSEYAGLRRLTTHGAPRVTTRHDASVDPDEVAVLCRLNKGSSAEVPIMVDDAIWGHLFFATGLGEPDFSGADVELLTAVGTLISGVVAHADAIDRMHRLAFEDPLTGLDNRRAVDDALADLEAAGRPVVLALVDVDGLKRWNDVDGHARGDEVLRRIGRGLAAQFPASDGWTVGRLGGDEFAVLGTGGDGVTVSARLAAVREGCRAAVSATFSFGVATATPPWTGRAVMKAADEALYAAKRRR